MCQSLKRGLALGVAAPCSFDSVASWGIPDNDNTPTNEPISVDTGDNELMSDVDDTQVKCASIHAEDNRSHTAAASDSNDYSHIQPVIDKLP